MSYKKQETYICDHCGKKLKREWWDSDEPKGWGRIAVNSWTSSDEYTVIHLCPKCVKKNLVYLVAVTPQVALTDFGEYTEGRCQLVSVLKDFKFSHEE